MNTLHKVGGLDIRSDNEMSKKFYLTCMRWFAVKFFVEPLVKKIEGHTTHSVTWYWGRFESLYMDPF